MRKIILLFTCCLCLGHVFAQDADKLRDEGDAALKDKNYAVAFEKYSEYLKLTDYADEGRVFNAGYSADQIENYPEAVRLFDMAIAKGYQKEKAYVGKAKALRDQNKSEEFVETVKAAFEEFPENDNLEKMVYGYFMKQAQAEQKKGDIKSAEKMFKEILIVSDKTYKSNALFSLGILHYNSCAKSLQAAASLAQEDPDKYAEVREKATAGFEQAKEYLEQALELNPENANAKKTLAAVKATLK